MNNEQPYCEQESVHGPPVNDNRLTPLKLNEDEYMAHLDAFDLSDAQKRELLQTLWNIMSILVDIGWGADTVQMLLPDLFEAAGDDSGKLTADNNKDKEGEKHEWYKAKSVNLLPRVRY